MYFCPPLIIYRTSHCFFVLCYLCCLLIIETPNHYSFVFRKLFESGTSSDEFNLTEESAHENREISSWPQKLLSKRGTKHRATHCQCFHLFFFFFYERGSLQLKKRGLLARPASFASSSSASSVPLRLEFGRNVINGRSRNRALV